MSAHSNPDDAYERFFNPSLFLEGGFSTQTVAFGHVQLEISGVSMPKIKDNEHLRIGHALWASAHAMSQYIVTYPQLVEEKDVLELGCGLGLTGLVAAKLSQDASRVILTDGDEHIFDALEINVEKNFQEVRGSSELEERCLPEMERKHTESTKSNCVADSLQLSVKRPKLAMLYWGEQVQGFKAKYGVFDTILGADVLYHAACVRPLLETVKELLRDANSKYLMAFQHQFGLRHRALLLEMAALVGLQYRLVDWSDVRRALQDKDPGYRESWDIEFLEFHLVS